MHKMDYKKELKKMQQHRENYFPIMNKLLGLHRNTANNKFPIRIDYSDDMLITLELIDIGYLDPDVFFVEKSFGDIKGLIYNGEYPFSEKGYILFKQTIFARRKKGAAIGLLVIVALVIALVLLFFK